MPEAKHGVILEDNLVEPELQWHSLDRSIYVRTSQSKSSLHSIENPWKGFCEKKKNLKGDENFATVPKQDA